LQNDQDNNKPYELAAGIVTGCKNTLIKDASEIQTSIEHVSNYNQTAKPDLTEVDESEPGGINHGSNKKLLKINRNDLPPPPPVPTNESVAVYAELDKSKKNVKARKENTFSEVSDVYAVVDKSSKK